MRVDTKFTFKENDIKKKNAFSLEDKHLVKNDDD